MIPPMVIGGEVGAVASRGSSVLLTRISERPARVVHLSRPSLGGAITSFSVSWRVCLDGHAGGQGAG